jgi:hypothetical protein
MRAERQGDFEGRIQELPFWSQQLFVYPFEELALSSPLPVKVTY